MDYMNRECSKNGNYQLVYHEVYQVVYVRVISDNFIEKVIYSTMSE